MVVVFLFLSLQHQFVLFFFFLLFLIFLLPFYKQFFFPSWHASSLPSFSSPPNCCYYFIFLKTRDTLGRGEGETKKPKNTTPVTVFLLIPFM